MGNYCPFVNGECRKDCVFYTHKTISDENGEKNCKLYVAVASADTLCDKIIREKEGN